MADFLTPPAFLNYIWNMIMENIFTVAIIAIAIYYIVDYLKFSTKVKLKPVDRGEIERLKFVERMRMNGTPPYNLLMRGNTLIGEIISYRKVTILKKLKKQKFRKGQKNQDQKPLKTQQKHEIVQVVVRPSISKKFKIFNPFAKPMAIQLNAEMIDFDNQGKNLILHKWVTLDYYFGIYYDMSLEETHVDFIKEDNLFRSDANMLASIYFAKSQEQSTFDPQHAHELALKEKELQIEMSKKTSKVTNI